MNPSVIALKCEMRDLCASLYLNTIEDIFSNAGFTRDATKPISSSNYTRRSLVDEYYSSVNWEEEATLHKLIQVIETILQLHLLPKESKEYIRAVCRDCGFAVANGGNKVLYEGNISTSDLFNHQFPGGLPFGKIKPGFAIKAERGSQIFSFEWQQGIGIIKNNIYPNFDYQKLVNSLGCHPGADIALRQALANMNQTEYERKFMIAYAKKFKMVEKNVPVIIPQAWIQWHSFSKNNLRANNSLHVDDIYRVDFVAFWNNQRFSILVDDIGHYAVTNGKHWLADEESYSKRLKEDRKLRNEGWQVFRLSNWELKNQDLVDDILTDLQSCIGF